MSLQSILKNISKQLWIYGFILTILLEISSALPFYPIKGDWKCNAGRVISNQTISGGIHAGQFKTAGYVKDISECIRYCCNEEKCDVALFTKKTCYLVSCNNKMLCRPVPAQSLDLEPQLSYLTHEPLHSNLGHITALKTFLEKKEKPSMYENKNLELLERKEDKTVQYDDGLINSNSLSDETGQKRRIILDRYAKNTPTKAEMFFQEQGFTSNLIKHSDANNCYPTTIHTSVSLRYGPDSGDFYDYGEIKDMQQCIDLCCKDKLCDVSFMVGKTCYTVSCYSFDKCQMIPASKKAKLNSQLAYVIKKTDISGLNKLKLSKNHEKLLENQEKKSIPEHQETKIDWQFDRDRDDASHTSKTDDEPNVPEGLTKHCKHNKVLKNHALIGGQRAGIYTFRGLTPGFAACLSLCCADLFCDAAFLLGKRCYSVQCYKNGQCASRPAISKRLHSALAFVERSDQLDLSEKRTSIPGLLPTDKQYSIWLNITNEEYKDEMVDTEALEFLNFAERLKGMVSEIYGAIQGFKYLEVLALKPKILRAKINITTDQTANPKVLLQKMVDMLRKGELKSHDDPVLNRLVVDVRGFKFLNSNGDNMICPPEYNYGIHWPLGVYGTFVSVPCPRKANGLTTRQCFGSESIKASWLIPDFSECVTDKYESLLREVQLLTSTSIHTPDLTSASIIDRLLQLTTSDTYGSSPPKEFASINRIEDAVPLPKKTDTKDPHNQFQLPFAKSPVSLKENLSSDQLKSYLHKMELSELLGKTNQPDMLSLYKSLSLRNNDIEHNGKVHQLKGASSIKYPQHHTSHHKLEVDNIHLPSTKNEVSLHTKHHKAVIKEFDKISDDKQASHHNNKNERENDSIDNRNSLTPKATKSDTFSSPQRPTGDLGAESPPGQAMIKAPLETTSEIIPSSLTGPSSELRMVKNANDLSSNIVQNQNNYVHNPYSYIRPASISKVDFEPITRTASSFENTHVIPNYLGSFKTNSDINRFNGQPNLNRNSMEHLQQPNSFHLQNQHASNTLDHQNLIDYYSHSLLEPNGVPMYQSRRDSTLHPSASGIINSRYPSQSETLAGASTLFNSIRKRRSSKNLTGDERASKYDAEFQSLFQQIYKRYRRNGDFKRLLVEHDTLLDNVFDNVTTKNRKKLYDKTHQNERRAKESQHLSRKLEKIFKDMKLRRRKRSTPTKISPYVKIIEKPVVIDIPTGQVVPVLSKLDNAKVSFAKNSFIESEAQYDTNPAHDTLSNRESTTKINSPNITIVSQADITYQGGKSKGKSKVESSVDIKCIGDDKECAKRIPDILKSKPASQVIDEKQIVDTQKQEPFILTSTIIPTISTTTTSVKTTIATTIQKTSKKKTKLKQHPSVTKPTDGPTVNPVFQDVDETEPENEHQNPQAKESENQQKPIISITVLNKTEGVSTGSSIETPTKNPIKQEKTAQGEHKKLKPSKEKTDKKPKKPKEEKVKEMVTNKEQKKLKKPNEESDLIFTYDKENGKEQAPMFGGDILLTIDISEELTKYAEGQTTGPTLIEIEEFLQTASTLLDEKNEMEWKHAIRHMKALSSDTYNADNRDMTEMDALDWRVMHKQKSVDKHNLLLGFIDTVEDYGKSVSSLFSRYNSKFQQPLITKNIIMQVRVILIEEILDKKEKLLSFPEYKKDVRLSKWNSGVEQISLPSSIITDKYEATKSIHVTYFRFKNIAEIEKPVVSEEREEQDIVDENPIMVGSQLLSMSVDLPLGERLNKPVSITFANNDLSQHAFPHVCSYWNQTKNSFDSNGCNLVFKNDSITTCECYHLTTFAVLVDTSKKNEKIYMKPSAETSQEKKPPISENDKSNEIDADEEKNSTKDKEVDQTPDELIQPEKSEPFLSKPHEEESPIEESPKTTEKSPQSSPTPNIAVTEKPEATSQKGNKSGLKSSKWFWIILLALLLLLLLFLLLLLCCCFCRRRKRKIVQEAMEQKDIGSESSGPETIPASDNLVDKSKGNEDPKKGLVTAGSTVSSRTSSPEPGNSPGWKKLMSHANHPKQILLKEKALLFKDYVQPYHFLSEKEPPNTSVESIYGSTVTSYPQTANSEISSSKVVSPKRKRSYEPKNRRERTSPVPKTRPVEQTKPVSSVSSPKVVEKEPKIKLKDVGVAKPVNEKVKATEVIASQMTEATSMEWDPYLENKQKLNKKGKPSPPRRKRNISPISEENEDEHVISKLTKDNIKLNSDLESPVASDTSYMESHSSSTRTVNYSSENSSPPTRRNENASLSDSDSSESRSTALPGERRIFTTASESSDDSPVLKRGPGMSKKTHTDSTSESPTNIKRTSKLTTPDSASSSPRTTERANIRATRLFDKHTSDTRDVDDI